VSTFFPAGHSAWFRDRFAVRQAAKNPLSRAVRASGAKKMPRPIWSKMPEKHVNLLNAFSKSTSVSNLVAGNEKAK
jgi:hypothetical protein